MGDWNWTWIFPNDNLVPKAFSSTIFKMADRRENRHFENRRGEGPGDEVAQTKSRKHARDFHVTILTRRGNSCYAGYHLTAPLSDSKNNLNVFSLAKKLKEVTAITLWLSISIKQYSPYLTDSSLKLQASIQSVSFHTSESAEIRNRVSKTPSSAEGSKQLIELQVHNNSLRKIVNKPLERSDWLRLATTEWLYWMIKTLCHWRSLKS